MNLIYLLRSEHTKRLIYSTFDQVILSTINFILSYLLLKLLSKADYGIYNIIIPVSLIFTALQNALINTPLMVEYWNKVSSDRNLMVSSLLLIQKRYLTIFLISLISLFIFYSIFTHGYQVLILFLSFIALIVGVLSREFLRNYYFTIERPQAAVTNDFYYLLYITIFIIVIYFTGLVNVSSVLLAIGVSSLFSSIFKNRSLIIHKNYELAKKHFTDCFKHGKWALLGVIVTHIQTYGYIYLIGIFFTTKDIGDIAAIRLLFAPFAFVTVGYSKIAIPRGSKLVLENKVNKFFKEEVFFSFFYVLVIIIYTIFINLLPDDLLIKLLKKEYLNALDYLPYLSFSTVLSVLGSTGSNGLQAIKNFKGLSKINSLAMVVSFVLTIILIYLIGIKGALIANICSQLINISGMWYIFNNARKY